MSELTLFLIRAAFLAILWIFVLSAISVIRSDMFGARVPESVRGAAAPKPERKPGRTRKPRRGAPTHLLVVEGEKTADVIVNRVRVRHVSPEREPWRVPSGPSGDGSACSRRASLAEARLGRKSGA